MFLITAESDFQMALGYFCQDIIFYTQNSVVKLNEIELSVHSLFTDSLSPSQSVPPKIVAINTRNVIRSTSIPKHNHNFQTARERKGVHLFRVSLLFSTQK